MPKYISPLDDTYIRFDAAAELLSRHHGKSTPEGMLEMLTIAMWKGRFNPPDCGLESEFGQAQRNDFENWLAIPIEQPGVLLNDRQRALKPKPFEYYEAGRDTILSVMYCDGLLPGDQHGWHDMLEGKDGLLYLHDKANAFATLVRMPLICYSDYAKAYLKNLYIPRYLLKTWLDRRSLDFEGLFVPKNTPQLEQLPSKPANDAVAQKPTIKRGRPALPAWTMIEAWAVKLDAQNPDMQRKQLAGRLYMMALEQFDKSAVPNESTILRKLSSFLD